MLISIRGIILTSWASADGWKQKGMCDGLKHNRGVTIATNAFSVAENELLINALNKKFSLNSRIISDHGYPSIHISYKDLPQLQNLIVPYMHQTLLYKISL